MSDIQTLIATLKGGNPRARRAAAWRLSDFRADAREAVPALIEALESWDRKLREACVCALAEIDPKAAVPAFIRALEDPTSAVRHWAAVALGRVGPEAKEAVPALEKALMEAPRGDEDVFFIALAEIDTGWAKKYRDSADGFSWMALG